MAKEILMLSPNDLKDGAHLRGEEGAKGKYLLSSLNLKGQLFPIEAWKNSEGEYEIIDGHSRLAAIKQMMKEGTLPANHKVQVHIQDVATREEAEFRSLATFARKPPNRAALTVRLMKMEESGMSPEQIAAEIGKDIRVVQKYLLFGRKATKALMAAVSMGLISFSVAVKIANLPPDEQLEALRVAVGEGDDDKAKKRLRRLNAELDKFNAPKKKVISAWLTELDRRLSEPSSLTPEMASTRAFLIHSRETIRLMTGMGSDEEILFDPSHPLLITSLE